MLNLQGHIVVSPFGLTNRVAMFYLLAYVVMFGFHIKQGEVSLAGTPLWVCLYQQVLSSCWMEGVIVGTPSVFY